MLLHYIKLMTHFKLFIVVLDDHDDDVQGYSTFFCINNKFYLKNWVMVLTLEIEDISNRQGKLY